MTLKVGYRFKTNLFRIRKTAKNTCVWVVQEKENLFLYVNQAFAPSPDQTLANLCECFGSDSKLTLYYSRSLKRRISDPDQYWILIR